MEIESKLTFGIAVYGAALGTVGTLISLATVYRGWRANQRNIIVKLGRGFSTNDASQECVTITVFNPRSSAVEITGLSIEYPTKQHTPIQLGGMMSHGKIPQTLAPGHSISGLMPVARIRSAVIELGFDVLVTVKGLATDSSGKSYRSKPLEVHLS